MSYNNYKMDWRVHLRTAVYDSWQGKNITEARLDVLDILLDAGVPFDLACAEAKRCLTEGGIVYAGLDFCINSINIAEHEKAVDKGREEEGAGGAAGVGLAAVQ